MPIATTALNARAGSWSIIFVGVTENVDSPRLAADRMLARLARWLRLCGVDVTFDATVGGADLLHAARREGRMVLTRDKRLRTASDVLYLGSERVRDQLREVLQRFAIDPRRGALTRCSRCNSLLCEVDGAAVKDRVPPFVYSSQRRFCECPRCGRIYWRATHPARILAEIDRVESGQSGDSG
jgi:uncharacterized protein with PIN domain